MPPIPRKYGLWFLVIFNCIIKIFALKKRFRNEPLFLLANNLRYFILSINYKIKTMVFNTQAYLYNGDQLIE